MVAQYEFDVALVCSIYTIVVEMAAQYAQR